MSTEMSKPPVKSPLRKPPVKAPAKKPPVKKPTKKPPVKKASARRPRLEVYRDLAGAWRWRLVGANGRKVATSGEPFSSRSAALRAMNALPNVVHQACAMTD